MLHIFLHFLVPLIISYSLRNSLFKFSQWWLVYILMMVTMLVDLDHLLADPIYDPGRCSINFHPLHQVVLFPGYIALMFFERTRAIGFGLVIHMVLDSIDCQVTNGVWWTAPLLA
ncbi:DUF6122 family protein [Pleionea litopenaei]|uniref:DUF6122 family protein n=1 Tax=Pleionea litopenaei TaxID=3070815 RepID=A0AA51X5W2_9GAMM|nr:DUF6122 family protein [Pleionea sp. HL-JVS1]WMS86617.1 DUF6122 family protein [Pleionea sp. HL-JVS1]